MSDEAHLEFLRDGEPARRVGIGQHPLRIGRAPDNDVVLADDTVSSRHATFWVEGGRVWVRDQGSRNGTFVNDRRINAATPLDPDDRVRLGVGTDLRLIGRPSARTVRARLLEEVSTGIRFPVRVGRFDLGSGPDDDLFVPDAAPSEGVLVLHQNGEIWFGNDADEGPLELGDEFRVGNRAFRVVEVEQVTEPTSEASGVRHTYRVSATLAGPTGAEALLEDLDTGAQMRVSAETRATLLFVLAEALVRSRAEQLTEAEQGWIADEEVSRAVWGKKAAQDSGGLHVLVHRLRNDLKKSGFDPWFIEKRRRAIRLFVPEVVLK